MGKLVPINAASELNSCVNDGHFDGTMGIRFTRIMAHVDRNNKAEKKTIATRVKVEVVPAPDAHLRLKKALQLILAAADRDERPDSECGDFSTANGPRS